MATRFLDYSDGTADLSGNLKDDTAGVAPVKVDSADGIMKYYDRVNSLVRTVVDLVRAQTLSNKTFVAPVLGAATGTSVAVTGVLTSSGATSGIGYATGAGGAVTQITSRTTGVTINKISGTITTDTTSLAAEAAAAFVVTNSAVAIGDIVVVSQRSGAVGAMTTVEVVAVAAGSFTLSVMNNNPAAGVAETGAIIINFAVIKAVSA